MITFPLREAMCSGVMPFWKGRNRNQLGCGIFLSNAAALHPTPLSPPTPGPSPTVAAMQEATFSLLLGHFSPRNDLKIYEDVTVLWVIAVIWPRPVSQCHHNRLEESPALQTSHLENGQMETDGQIIRHPSRRSLKRHQGCLTRGHSCHKEEICGVTVRGRQAQGPGPGAGPARGPYLGREVDAGTPVEE